MIVFLKGELYDLFSKAGGLDSYFIKEIYDIIQGEKITLDHFSEENLQLFQEKE